MLRRSAGPLSSPVSSQSHRSYHKSSLVLVAKSCNYVQVSQQSVDEGLDLCLQQLQRFKAEKRNTKP